MKAGIVRMPVGERAEFAAPPSGVQLGVGESGALSLRLFRLAGTRFVLAARVLPAQLIALRVAAAGTPVQVLTGRPQLWEPLLSRAAGHVITPNEQRQPGGGPTLVVDDRPTDARGPAEIRPWQCRLDVRTQWTPSLLQTFAHSDLTIFGAIPAEFTSMVARAFAVPAGAAEPLARLDSGSFAALHRGDIQYVSLNPTAAEGQLLEQVRGVESSGDFAAGESRSSVSRSSAGRHSR